MMGRLLTVLWLLAGLWALLCYYMFPDQTDAIIMATIPAFVLASVTYIVHG